MVSKNEDYRGDPGKNLRDTLRTCGWIYFASKGAWFKVLLALEMDHIGVFLFRFHGGRFERTHGLSWNQVKAQHLDELQICFNDGYKLEL